MSAPERDIQTLARSLKDLMETVARVNRRVRAAESEIEDLKGRVYDLEADVRALQ